MLYLHGGWGYSVHPFERQVDALGSRFRVVIPDRVGFGLSGRRAQPLPLDFHRRAAQETLGVMDALGLERAMLWGHSDGACIAVWMGLEAPERCGALVLEALHFSRAKPSSRSFFETATTDPTAFGERVSRLLADEHGEDYWRDVLALGGAVWLALGESEDPPPDLYGGRLPELLPPALILHGADDPRTEPGEIAAVQEALPAAEVCLIEGGRHCPHVEKPVWQHATAAASEFLNRYA